MTATANDLTIYSLRGAVTTFGVILAVFALGFLLELPRRRRARDRRRAAYAEAWRAEYLVGFPLVDVVEPTRAGPAFDYFPAVDLSPPPTVPVLLFNHEGGA